MAAVQPEVDEEHWAVQIYEAMVLRGVDPHKMVTNFDKGPGSRIILALPDSKVGLATDGDQYDALAEDGWKIISLPLGALKSFASTARDLNTAVVSHRVRMSSSELIKTGSEDEARLLNGILRAHLPPPERNFRIMREDAPGQELTVPDFTWPRQQVAFFMDGLWWHHGRDSDIHKKVALGTADKEVLDEAEKQQMSRATRDANNRSDLALMGWVVLSCSDEEIADEAGVLRQVQKIKKALQKASHSVGDARKERGAPTTEEESVVADLDEMFGVLKQGAGYSAQSRTESGLDFVRDGDE